MRRNAAEEMFGIQCKNTMSRVADAFEELKKREEQIKKMKEKGWIIIEEERQDAAMQFKFVSDIASNVNKLNVALIQNLEYCDDDPKICGKNLALEDATAQSVLNCFEEYALAVRMDLINDLNIRFMLEETLADMVEMWKEYLSEPSHLLNFNNLLWLLERLEEYETLDVFDEQRARAKMSRASYMMKQIGKKKEE